MDQMNRSQAGMTCSEAHGILPGCAPLANPYVPFQQEHASTYQAPTGLIRGTLYPGLDLPFMGMVNQKEKTANMANWLHALHFAISELGLYLDTHPSDMEALELFNQYVEQYGEAMQNYEQKHGALNQMAAGMHGRYDWLDGPWPWDYEANKEG